MRSASERREFLDVSTTQRASADLVKQIRKLRWIGMEEEARRLQIALSGMPAADRVLSEAQDTD
jgi:hypothetical protein